MNGLLGSGAPAVGDPYAREKTLLPHNVTIQELIEFLLKRGLLGGTANAITPVNPAAKETVPQTIQRRPGLIDAELDRQMGYR